MLIRNMLIKFYGGYRSEEGGAEQGGGGGEQTTTTTEPEAKTPAVEQAKPEPSQKAEPSTVDYTSVIAQYAEGKPALAVALGFLGECNIDPSSQAFELAKGGDFTLLEAELAKLGKTGTTEMLAILKQEVEANDRARKDHEARTEQTLTNILGDSKDVIIAWARESAEPAEKEAINELLEAGGFYAHCAAVALREAYASSNQTQRAANPIKESQSIQGGATPLTAREFAEECEKLSKANGGADPRLLKGYQELATRRAVGRKQGK